MDSRKTVACVALLCCAAFVAVAWVSGEDAAPSILEEANSKMLSGLSREPLYEQSQALYRETLLDQKDLEDNVPSTEFNGVDASFVQRSFKRAQMKPVVWKKWRQYPFGGKNKILKKKYPKWFKKTNRACALIRQNASRKCAKHFCKAGKACDAPCIKRILQPPRMVIPLPRNPLDKSSPLWYQNNEVGHKESRAKEQKTKELTFKQNRAKREIARERKAKEQEAKEDLTKEKKAKKIAVKERIIKKQQATDLAEKVKEDKYKETVHKLHTKKKCTKTADKVITECNVKEDVAKKKVKSEVESKARLANSKYKLAQQAEEKAIAKDKAAQKAAAAAQKKETADKAAANAASAAADKEKIAKEKHLAAHQEKKIKEDNAKEKIAKELEVKRKEKADKKEKAEKAAEKKKKEGEAKERGAKERISKEKAAKQKELDEKERARKEKAAKEAAEKEKAHKAAVAEKAAKEANAKAAAREKSTKEKATKEKTAKQQAEKSQKEKQQKQKNKQCRGTSWCETFHTCVKGDGRNFYSWVKNQGYKQHNGACATSAGAYGHRHKYWGGSFTMSQCMAKCDAMGTSCQGISMTTAIDCSGKAKWKDASLACTTTSSASNSAGVVVAGFSSHLWNQGYRMTGGGINNHYRSFNKLAGFEEAFPIGDGNGNSRAFQCDTGFGPGKVTCYSRQCKVPGMTCTVKSTRHQSSGVSVVYLPSGYVATGGGMYNHYRNWDKKAAFEESMPSGSNGWQCDMGIGSGDFTCYVRGCKGSTSSRLSCLTKQSGPANYHTVSCPSGYSLTSCGQKEMRRKWDALSGFESYQPHGNGCACDSGFGNGSNYCYARCCKLQTLSKLLAPAAELMQTEASSEELLADAEDAEEEAALVQRRKFVLEYKDGMRVGKAVPHDWDYKWKKAMESGTKTDNAVKKGNKVASALAKKARKIARELRTAEKKSEKEKAQAEDLKNKNKDDNDLENDEKKEDAEAEADQKKNDADLKANQKFEKDDEKKGYWGKADWSTMSKKEKEGDDFTFDWGDLKIPEPKSMPKPAPKLLAKQEKQLVSGMKKYCDVKTTLHAAKKIACEHAAEWCTKWKEWGMHDFAQTECNRMEALHKELLAGAEAEKKAVMIGVSNVKVHKVGECAEKRRVAYEKCDKASAYKSLVSEQDKARHEFNIAAKTKKESDAAAELSKKQAAIATALALKLARANSALKKAEDAVAKIAEKAAHKAKGALKKLPKRMMELSQSLTGMTCNWECYLNRYTDLQRAFGKSGPTALAKAKAHWYRHGIKEGRNCQCDHLTGFVHKYSHKWPHCVNLNSCLKGSLEKFKLECAKQPRCQGFSFTAGLSKNGIGNGCMKQQCKNDGKNGFGHGSHGYWEKDYNLTHAAATAAKSKKDAAQAKAKESSSKHKQSKEAKVKTAAVKAQAYESKQKATAAAKKAVEKNVKETMHKNLTKKQMASVQKAFENKQKKKMDAARKVANKKMAARIKAIQNKLHAANAASLHKEAAAAGKKLAKHHRELKAQASKHAAQRRALARHMAAIKKHQAAIAKDKAQQKAMKAKKKVYTRFWRNQGSNTCKAAISKQHKACQDLLNGAYHKCLTMSMKRSTKTRGAMKKKILHPKGKIQVAKMQRWHSQKVRRL